MKTILAKNIIRRAGLDISKGKVNGVDLITAATAIAKRSTTRPIPTARSRDDRTNVWRVTCPVCENQFSPATTRLATQEFMCPICQSCLHADYNAEPSVVKVLHVGLN